MTGSQNGLLFLALGNLKSTELSRWMSRLDRLSKGSQRYSQTSSTALWDHVLYMTSAAAGYMTEKLDRFPNAGAIFRCDLRDSLSDHSRGHPGRPLQVSREYAPLAKRRNGDWLAIAWRRVVRANARSAPVGGRDGFDPRRPVFDDAGNELVNQVRVRNSPCLAVCKTGQFGRQQDRADRRAELAETTRPADERAFLHQA